jgi:hypothetical protein
MSFSIVGRLFQRVVVQRRSADRKHHPMYNWLKSAAAYAYSQPPPLCHQCASTFDCYKTTAAGTHLEQLKGAGHGVLSGSRLLD